MGNNWLLWTLVSILVALFTVCSSVNAESFSIVGYDPNDLHSEEGLLRLFETWRSRHGKLYHSLEEKAKRFNIFKRNTEFVELHNRNRRSSGHWVGLNKFADWSNEEFQAVYSKRINNPRRPLATPKAKKRAESCEAPSSLDWRKKGAVTGIKNQGDCGSCWSFSSTGAIEGINEITTGELISLSEQELVSCDTTNDGCEGGYMDYAFEWVIQNGGIDTESDYPYTGTDSTCISSKEEKKIVTIDGYTDVAESDSALLCAAAQQPISVGMDGSAIDFQLYTGGIYDGDCSSDPDDIDHAVLIVGYSSEESEDYWIVKNSWGTDWGIAGYFYLRRNTNLTYGVCAVNAMASYPTKEGSSPGPQPSPAVTPPPPPPPPPPPSPEPVQCGDYSYCASGETCCCVFELLDFCLLYGCCELENAVCCTGTSYCCPADYPICDVEEGLCLQGAGDSLGMEMTKRKRAHYKLPWERHGFGQVEEKSAPSLKWRRHAVQ